MAKTVSPGPDLTRATVRALLGRAREAGHARDVRADIVGSWQRSTMAGLTPDVLNVPFAGDVDDGGRLTLAADPVMTRLGDDLDGTRIGLMLTDANGLIVNRRASHRGTLGLFDNIQLAPGFVYSEDRVGTNAIGTALQERVATFVDAEEHFSDALTKMACAAMTITDPASGRVLGALDLSSAASDANPLMLPLAKRAAWEIEQRLLDDSTPAGRRLQQHFLRARRATRAPLLAINQQSLLVNAAATNLIQPTEHARLWECILPVLRTPNELCSFVPSTGDPLTLRVEPLLDGTQLVGVLVHVRAADDDATPAARPGRQRSNANEFGWDSLTEAELAVARHVSQGMTNREAAAYLCLSPHTIDFHLRALFRKLDIKSRVELTRIVLEHEHQER